MTNTAAKRVRDKDGKRRALLDAATEVFAEQGFDAAITKEIARRAGCSESLLFRYYGDKQGIFEQIVSRQIAEGATKAEEKVVASLPNTFTEFVEQLFLARLRVHRLHDTVPGWDIAGRALSDPAFSRRVMRPNNEHRNGIIAEGVRHYQAQSQVAADVDPDMVAELLGNFIIFTTTVGPRWFGTREDKIRKQIVLGARIFANGVSVTKSSKYSDSKSSEDR